MKKEYIYKIEFESSVSNSYIYEILAKNFDDAYFKAMKIMKEDSKCYRVRSIKEVQDIFIIEEND